MNELEILQNLIQHDSQFTKTNKSIVEFIASLFPRENVQITKLEKNGLEIFNIAVKFDGKNHDHPLIFSGHTDTVPASSKWARDPFTPHIEGNKIYGLGASDMKSGLACIIAAALKIDTQPKQDIHLLFDADEEGASTGGRDFINRLRFENDCADIIIPEPTNCKIFFGQKGAVDIDITFSGTSFHSSKATFEKNIHDNAIYKATRAMIELQALEQKLNSDQDPGWGKRTQSICTISGGIANNVTADSCTIGISRRTFPDENLSTVINEMSQIATGIDSNAKINVNMSGESFEIKQDSKLLQQSENISRDIIKSVNTEVAPYWTQAGLFKKWGDCIIWGPGSIDQAHLADESCEINNIELMTRCYQKLIKSRL